LTTEVSLVLVLLLVELLSPKDVTPPIPTFPTVLRTLGAPQIIVGIPRADVNIDFP